MSFIIGLITTENEMMIEEEIGGEKKNWFLNWVIKRYGIDGLSKKKKAETQINLDRRRRRKEIKKQLNERLNYTTHKFKCLI